MSRFSRINTIWRKELIDTLRDRRTLVAMVLVPMVLYPALMLGSLQALEVQVSYLVVQTYTVAVENLSAQRWLQRVIDEDPARRQTSGQSAEEVAELAKKREPAGETPQGGPVGGDSEQRAKAGVREHPPEYRIITLEDVKKAVYDGRASAGVILEGPPPVPGSTSSTRVVVAYDDSDIRSEIAAEGLAGVLTRANDAELARRMQVRNIEPAYLTPLDLQEKNVASSERMAGAVLGQIVPLILIVMTITGAIYPAIDLTAGERERGTLETLMVAPVPTVDLIAGKFIVVTMIGLLSAVLNLLSVGGTIYFGGVSSILTQGRDLVFPLSALPWILLLLVPLAVMFSAMLLAVCSFARSFKEAQNYIVPVMMAALIPGVVGILPGTRLEGPVLIMPVANIVVLTRDLFLGKTDIAAILIVVLSTSLYAGAAVAVAAKLFGQEAVLFADSGSIKTIFIRRFFKPRKTPTAASALLVLAVVFSLNFYIQQAIGQSFQGVNFLHMLAITLAILLGLGPFLAMKYMRVDATRTFRLAPPPALAIIAALCFGLSAWVLARAWLAFQSLWFPMDPAVEAQLAAQMGWMNNLGPFTIVFYLAVVPALCEELFFRGYVLSGVRSSLGKLPSLIIVSLAFGIYHYSAHRLALTTMLGFLLALLVVQYRSIWPSIIAHMTYNAINALAEMPDGLKPMLDKLGYSAQPNGMPATPWIIGAAAVTAVGIAICLLAPREPVEDDNESQDSSLPEAPDITGHATAVCANCGHLNDSGAAQCVNCGVSLAKYA